MTFVEFFVHVYTEILRPPNSQMTCSTMHDYFIKEGLKKNRTRGRDSKFRDTEKYCSVALIPDISHLRISLQTPAKLGHLSVQRNDHVRHVRRHVTVPQESIDILPYFAHGNISSTGAQECDISIIARRDLLLTL